MMRAALTILSILCAVGCLSAVAENLETPWGDPDLRGIWTTATLTPLERPQDLADRATLSSAETANLEKVAEERFAGSDARPPPGGVGGYNKEWLDPGMKALTDGRTALIVDPPDGRIPWTVEAKATSDRQRARYGVGPFYAHTDMDTGERCLSDGVTMAPLQPYNMNYQIFQNADYVAINHEMYHEYRIIPLDERPYVPEGVTLWLGDARGHWEGATLVIESRRFPDKTGYYWAWPWRASRPGLKVTERLTRVDETTIDYRFTIEDPAMFTQAWTAAVPMTSDQTSRGVTSGPLFEYACHEANYALPNVLRGAALQRQGSE